MWRTGLELVWNLSRTCLELFFIDIDLLLPDLLRTGKLWPKPEALRALTNLPLAFVAEICECCHRQGCVALAFLGVAGFVCVCVCVCVCLFVCVCVLLECALRHEYLAYFLHHASPFDPARQRKGKDLRRLTVTGQGQTCSSANEDPKSIRPRSHLPFTLYCSTVVEAGLDSRSRFQIFKIRNTFSSLLKSPSTFLEGVENQN